MKLFFFACGAIVATSACTVATDDEPEATTSAELTSGVYDAARGNVIAARALALWSGGASRNLCLAGVNDTLERSGVVTPASPRLRAQRRRAPS